MWSPGRSVSFPLPFSLSFSLRENQGRAGWVGSRGRRCHPASRVLRLPLPAPGADGPRSAFIAPPGTAGGGGGARSRGRGLAAEGRGGPRGGVGRGAGPAEPGARSSREARWPHVTPAQLVLEQWLPLARSGRPLRPPPASSSAACRRRRRLLLHHCIMLRARRQRTAES